MCPGSFSAGLNSPERGEGRWAQNCVRMLAMAGHDVYGASGGIGPNPQHSEGAILIDQKYASRFGPFDLYIDAAWWDKKEPAAEAKKYVALKWSIEGYLREPFQSDFYLAYPYAVHHHLFSKTDFVNRDKTFALPTMFGEGFLRPQWQNSKLFIPGKIDVNRAYKSYIPAIGKVLGSHPVEGISREFFEKELPAGTVDFNRPDSNWSGLMTYDKVLESMRRCKINVPFLNPGCIIEAAFQGLPSIFWAHGGFYNPLAEMMNISVEHDAPPERFLEVFDLLMTNKKKYHEVVMLTQEYFSAHTYANAMKYFDLMVDSIF